MSQCGNIYAYLADGGTLTPLEALIMFGTIALHSRASELRKRGIKIKCELIEVNGKRVGRYSLDKSISGETRPAESPRNYSKGGSHEINSGFPQASCGPAEMQRTYKLENLNLRVLSEPGRISPAIEGESND